MEHEDVMVLVLSNETTARDFVRMLNERGVVFTKNIHDMTHEECVDAVVSVGTELRLRDYRDGVRG